MHTYRQETSCSPSFFSGYTTPEPSEDIKRFVLGLDFDGCTDTRVARAKLSDDVANFVVDHPEIEELDVIISSLRQTLLLDSDNAHRNPVDEKGRRQSCTAITEEFLSDVKWKIALLFEKNRIKRPMPKIKFHPLLLSDIYYGLPYGTTFNKMQECQHYTRLPFNKNGFVQARNLFNKPVDLAHYNRNNHRFEKVWNSTTPGFEFADTSKLLMLWVQMQYFAQNVYQPGQPFVFRFVDDKPDIIDSVTQFFEENPLLVPANCSLESLYMSSNDDHYPPEMKPIKIVTGLGGVQDQYRTICNNIALQILDSCDPNDFSAKEAMTRSLLLEHNRLVEAYSSDGAARPQARSA